MSDNRRVYRTIRTALKQMYPTEPKGNTGRMLTTLVALVSGIVQGKSCQLPTIARKAPDHAKTDSRIKRYSRWVQNERIAHERYYLPFVRELLDREIFHSPVEARQAVFAFIEGWYNLHRLHSALGYTSPVQFERSHTHHVGLPSPHLSTKAALTQFSCFSDNMTGFIRKSLRWWNDMYQFPHLISWVENHRSSQAGRPS